MFPNFVERLCQDLRPNFYEDESFHVQKIEDPISHAWKCAQKLVQEKSLDIEHGFVSRKEYLEYGSDVFVKKQKRILI